MAIVDMTSPLSFFVVPVIVVPGVPVPLIVTDSPLYRTGCVLPIVRGIVFDAAILSLSSPILRLMDFSFPLESVILKSTLSAF